MVRWRVAAVLVGFVLLSTACGDDGDDTDTGDPSDDTPAAGDDDADDADADTDDTEGDDASADVDAGTTLVQNFFSIDGEQYPITINTCFGAPGVDLEVIARVGSAADTEVYAYVYTDGEGGELLLSAFRVNDATQGLAWSNESGDGATDLSLDGRRVTGQVPVTSPDGATARATFDFACPGG